ncbi:MAG: WbqC family protein [Pseudomonadota bacterium]
MTIISTSQPYFSPYPGLFFKAHLSDILVILDTVQFPRGTTWLTRNRFKNDKGNLWMTIPVWKRGMGLQRIDEVKICHEFFFTKKHLTSLRTAYANAPFFSEHLGFLEEIFSRRFEKLIDLNLMIIRYLLEYLHISTRIISLSELGIGGRGDQLLMEICRGLEGSHLLAQKAAKKYLNGDSFEMAGIHLKFFRPPSLVYPQLWGSFIPNLSIFDLIFNCGPKAYDILVGGHSPEISARDGF